MHHQQRTPTLTASRTFLSTPLHLPLRRRGIMATGLACGTFGAIYPFLTSPVPIMLCGFLLVAMMSLFLAFGLCGSTP
jgi:hypothetical protein